MKKIFDTQTVRALEKKTMEKAHIGELALIDCAAGALADHIEKIGARYGKIYAFCGKGKNGADGIAAALKLRKRGFKTAVVLIWERLCPEGEKLLALYKESGGEVYNFGEHNIIINNDIIIDSIFGTGLNKAVTGTALEAIEFINDTEAFVISADIPSGINADSGQVMCKAVYADLCITFSFAKNGHIFFPGREYSIQSLIADIGLEPGEGGIDWIEDGDVKKAFPPRALNTHKGNYGKIAVIAGSTGMMGAAMLSCEAALRTGSGMVTLAYPRSWARIYEQKMHEVISKPLADKDGSISLDSIAGLNELAAGKDAAAVGMGIGRSEETIAVIKNIVLTYNIPLLLDADALFALSHYKELLPDRKAPTVITPHAMEMARLVGCTVEDVMKYPLKTAEEFAHKYRTVVLLKGATTLVCAPDGRKAAITNGSPALAKAGAGDVLSGIITALMGMGKEPYEAAYLGAYIHAGAGSRCAGALGEYSVCASDVVEMLPKVLLEFTA